MTNLVALTYLKFTNKRFQGTFYFEQKNSYDLIVKVGAFCKILHVKQCMLIIIKYPEIA